MERPAEGTVCVTGPQCRVTSAELHKAYSRWAEENGEPELSSKALSIRLQERPGVYPKRAKSWRGWAGIGLRAEG